MVSPCPHCGETNTRCARRGMIYDFFWGWGYDLRRCSFCNRRRLLKRPNPHGPHPDDMTFEELREQFEREIAKSFGKTSRAPVMSGSKIERDSSARSNGAETKTAGTSVALMEAF